MAEAVRVLVRCRPMNAREKSLKCRKVIDIDTSRNSVSILPLKKDDTNPPKQFTFDGAYGDDSKTSTIYNEMAASLVENVIEGFNATVFAYGQTGCGKSYTMEGAEIDDNSSSTNLPENAGIIPRACTDLFDSVALAGNSKKFLVHASYVEIYNENVRDLLANGKGNSLELKEHPDSGVYVKGLTMHRVTTAASATKLMAKGWSSRMTGATLSK